MKNRVLVFTPTYNEIGNIEKWLDEVASYSSADILVVDDSSNDGTISKSERIIARFLTYTIILL